MEDIKNFIERNKDTYIEQYKVSKQIIDKYNQLFKNQFPKEILWIWENMGFGIYESGYLQIVNPDEYAFAFEYIDKLLEPTIIWGITAMGDLLMWEGNDNWTIAPDEGNRAAFVNVRKCKKIMLGHQIDVFLDILINDNDDLIKSYSAKHFLEIKNKLPALKYGECYGYFPALALGGSASIKNLKITDAKTYIDIIGQAAGKIIDLED
jgi:hypothetical protein